MGFDRRDFAVRCSLEQQFKITAAGPISFEGGAPSTPERFLRKRVPQAVLMQLNTKRGPLLALALPKRLERILSNLPRDCLFVAAMKRLPAWVAPELSVGSLGPESHSAILANTS
jgi:hypothetical protein